MIERVYVKQRKSVKEKERKSKRNFKILFTFANIPYIRLDNNENVQFWENIS